MAERELITLSEMRMKDAAMEVIRRFGIEGWDEDDLLWGINSEIGDDKCITPEQVEQVAHYVRTAHITWATPEEEAEEEATWRSMMGINDEED